MQRPLHARRAHRVADAPARADDQGSVVTWGGHVTDEEYAAAPDVES